LWFTDLQDEVSSAGFHHLASLPKLQELMLCSTKLDDQALRDAATFPKLQQLNCAGAFTDEGLQPLAANESITELVISTTAAKPFTNAALVHLGKMKKLKSLDLTMVMSFDDQVKDKPWPEPWAITNDGLRHLAGLTELEELGLMGNQITDAGLVHLRGLKK